MRGILVTLLVVALAGCPQTTIEYIDALERAEAETLKKWGIEKEAAQERKDGS